MIYLCEPCKYACKCCEKSCEGFNKACNETCKGFGDICKRPMGGWVLLTILGQTLILAGSAWTVVQIMDAEGDEAKKADAENCDNAKLMCFIAIGLAVMHILISVYVQNAIVQKITKDSPDVEEPGAKEIMEATKHIIAYDFVFCFYVFALPGGTFYMIYGLSDLDSGSCTVGSNQAWTAAMCMVGYGFCTMMYLPCMYCGTCCASQTKKVGKKGKAAATKVGAPQGYA